MIRRKEEYSQKFVDGRSYESKRLNPVYGLVWGVDGQPVAAIIKLVSQNFRGEYTYQVALLSEDKKSVDIETIEELNDMQLSERGWSLVPKGPDQETLTDALPESYGGGAEY